jgi:hypothetical protein
MADPRPEDVKVAEAQAAWERETRRTAELVQRRGDEEILAGERTRAYDAWVIERESDGEPVSAAERSAKRRALELDTIEESLAQLDRLVAGQPARIKAATARLEAARWSRFLTDDRPLQASARELLARALETPPKKWPREILPELQAVAILVERARRDHADLHVSRPWPENIVPLPALAASVPALMKFFVETHFAMNGLNRRKP